MERLLAAFCILVHLSGASSVTAEEGKRAVLQCPGYTPDSPEYMDTIYQWYKASNATSSATRVAFYVRRKGITNSEGDLAGRAAIDGRTGALEILGTKVSDDHVYTCSFRFTETGTVLNKTKLSITVTPSSSDLNVIADPQGPVSGGRFITYKCSASRVRPPPTKMYWQFTDESKPNQRQKFQYSTNKDNLTSTASVEYSMQANRGDLGRKLVCSYVTWTGRTINSMETKIQVLFKPSGQPIVKAKQPCIQVNEDVELSCDNGTVDGAITWYKWQLANGTELVNTTGQTWTYGGSGSAGTVQLVCIAGNSLGQSDKSESLSFEIKSKPGTSKYLKIGLGTALAIASVGCIVFACLAWRNRRRKMEDGPSMPTVGRRNHINDAEDAKKLSDSPYDEPEYLKPMRGGVDPANDEPGYMEPMRRGVDNLAFHPTTNAEYYEEVGGPTNNSQGPSNNRVNVANHQATNDDYCEIRPSGNNQGPIGNNKGDQ